MMSVPHCSVKHALRSQGDAVVVKDTLTHTHTLTLIHIAIAGHMAPEGGVEKESDLEHKTQNFCRV